MKWILATLALAVAVNTQAADVKIGNVIAVERTVDNVFNTCIDQIQKNEDHDPNSSFFVCYFDVTKDAGEMVKDGRLLISREAGCAVDAEIKNSKIVMMFHGKDPKSNFATARRCLKTALDEAKNNDRFKIIVYTIE